jgi:hypothetical protein
LVGEVKEFVENPDPVRVIDAPLGIARDIGQTATDVFEKATGIDVSDDPRPGDRSNWMRDSKSHLDKKCLYQISMVKDTVLRLQTVLIGAHCSPELMIRGHLI